jgi:hypothetical protein
MEGQPLTRSTIYNISHYYIPYFTKKNSLELKISKNKSYKRTLCGPSLKRYGYSNFDFCGHILSLAACTQEEN